MPSNEKTVINSRTLFICHINRKVNFMQGCINYKDLVINNYMFADYIVPTPYELYEQNFFKLFTLRYYLPFIILVIFNLLSLSLSNAKLK